MADGPESTVSVDANVGGAQSEIKSLGAVFSDFFGSVGSHAQQGLGVFANLGKGISNITTSLVGELIPSLPSMGTVFKAAGGAAVTALSAIAGAVTAVVTGTFFLVKSFADAGDQMLTLKKQTGLSVEALSTFKYIGDQTGTSAESIANNVFKMGINIEKGGKQTEAAFKGIGTSTKELKQLSPEEQFAKIMSGLATIPTEAQRAAVGVQIFGKGFRDISQLTSEDLQTLTSNAHAFGLVMSDEMAQAGDTFGDTLNDMGSLLTGLKNTIGSFLLPIFNAFLGTVRDEMVVAFRMLRDAFTPLLGGFRAFGTSATDTAKSAEFHTNVLKTLITVIAGLIDAFAFVVKAAAAVIGVYYDLRIGANALLLGFGKLVETFLWGSEQIATAMSKITFGPVRAAYEADAKSIGEKLGQVRRDIANLEKSTIALDDRKQAITSTMTKFADTLNKGAEGLRVQAKEYKGVASAVDATRPSLAGMGGDFDDIFDKSGKAKEKISEFAKTATFELAALLKEWNAQPIAIRLNDESIKILLDKYEKLRFHVKELPPELEALRDAFLKPIKPTHDFGTAVGQIPFSTLKKEADTASVAIHGLTTDGLLPSTRSFIGYVQQVDASRLSLDNLSVIVREKVAKEAHDLRIKELDAMVQSFAMIAQAAGDSFGAVAQGIGGAIGSVSSIMKGTDSLKSAFSSLGKGDAMSGITSLVSGIGSITGAISIGINLAGKLWNAIAGTKGRDLVKEFVASEIAGGTFDALHKKLNEIGGDSERMWKLISQGVGRNNPEEAKAAIAAVTKFLEDGKKKQDEVAATTEAAAARQIAAHNAVADNLKKQIDALDGEMKSLSDSIAQEAPEEIMGAVETLQRARLDALRKEREALQNEVDEAARSTGEPIDDTNSGIANMGDKLRDNARDWESWARTAGSAIGGVADGVNGITFGKSPGGIKEWKPRLRESMAEFSALRSVATSALRDVRREVDALSPGLSPEFSASTSGGGGAFGGGGFGVRHETHIHIHGKDDRELHSFVFDSTQESFNNRTLKVPADAVLDVGQNPY